MKIGDITKKYIEKSEKHGANNYHPLDIVIKKAEGVWVYDVEGRKFLDCLASYSAVNQGHVHPEILAPAIEQMKILTLTSRAFHNDRMGDFLEKVCTITKKEKVLPMNTGAEAVETAIKMARKWAYKIKGVPRDKAEIIVCENNFHGRTTTIVGFSTEEAYRDGFGPFTPNFKIIPYGDTEALKTSINANTAAFMFEPIQGEGGVIVPRDGFIRESYDICKRNNVLFIADEIQTGFGRTGRMFCCDWENVEPDVYIMGKAISGGFYPLSAVAADHSVMQVFNPGEHGSTFGGNPLASAIGIAAIDVILNYDLPRRSFELGNYFKNELIKINSPYVKEIRGKGLFVGVEIKQECGTARPFCEKLFEKGILAKETHHQVIRFAPPLIITKEEIDWALDRIREVLS